MYGRLDNSRRVRGLFALLFSLVALFLLPVESFSAGGRETRRLFEQSRWLRQVEPDFELKFLRLTFRLRNSQELTQLLDGQQNPDSAHYRRWLTPEEFGARFGVSEATYEGAVLWLKSQGFSNVRSYPNRLLIHFDASAAQVEQAFSLRMGVYELEGKQHFSNDRDPEIPGTYGEEVLGIFGLDDFPAAVPLYRYGGLYAMGSRDLQIAYNLLPLYSRGITGLGQSIAIVGRTDFNLSDVQLFRGVFGLA